MTVPPVPRRRPDLVPRGPPPSSPPTDPARTPLQVPLRGTCRPSPERDPVRYTTTPLAGAGRSVTKIVDAIVRY
jgi:hypothetical protein